MTSEELINRIAASGLFEEIEIQQWTERIRNAKSVDLFMGELMVAIQNRTDLLLGVMGITDEKSDAYKQLLLDLYGELKGIAKEYKDGENQLEKESTEIIKDADRRDSQKHIEESREILASARK